MANCEICQEENEEEPMNIISGRKADWFRSRPCVPSRPVGPCRPAPKPCPPEPVIPGPIPGDKDCPCEDD